MITTSEKESAMRIGDKMNIKRAIWIAIMFVVGFTYFMIVRYVRLPHLKVFIYALPPHGLFVGIYNAIKGILVKVFGIIFGLFIALTGVNWVIKKIKFKFIRNLLQKIPPLPILRKFGIFDLIEGMFRVIFSMMPFHRRITEGGKIFGRYIARNTTEFMNLLGVERKLQNIKKNIQDQANAINPVSGITQKEEPSRQESMQRNKNLPDSPLFENSQFRKIDDEYKQCIEENIISPSPDMNTAEMQGINARNTVSRIVCKSQYLNSYLENLR